MTGPLTSLRQRRRSWLLASGLLVTELVAGIQAYLSQTVLPFMADDLAAREEYGVVIAAGWIATFVGMPLGVGLSRRLGVGRILVVATVVLIGGSILAALAPTLWVYILGTIVRGVAGGSLATVSMSALVVGLQGRTRQLVLAGMAGMWVIAALVGPTYAAGVTGSLGWRWALVAYLPIVLAARMLVAAHLPATQTTASAPIDFRQALLLGLAMAALTVPGLTGLVQLALMVVAGALMLVSLRALLPVGTFGLLSRRRSAFAVLLVLCGAYFGADAVLTPIAHDVFAMSPTQLNILLTAGGLGWAITGLACGARPAATPGAYLRRAATGTVLLFGGIGWLAVLDGGRAATPWLMTIAWTITGVGMGLVYVDTLNVIFTPPPADDGLDDLSVSAGVVIAESVAAAFASTATGSYLGQGFGIIPAIEIRAHTVLLALAVVTLGLVAPLIAIRRQWQLDETPDGLAGSAG